MYASSDAESTPNAVSVNTILNMYAAQGRPSSELTSFLNEWEGRGVTLDRCAHIILLKALAGPRGSIDQAR